MRKELVDCEGRLSAWAVIAFESGYLVPVLVVAVYESLLR